MQTEKHPLARRPIKPERFLALGFLALIFIGGALLSLPVSSAGGQSIGVLGGLFTATSAVCVTGLSIIDVGAELSMFGQVVLLLLIQIGGLGFMVFATLIMVALGRRISLKSRMLLRDSMNQSTLSGMVRLTLAFFLMALVIEVVGALLLMTRLVPLYGTGQGVWYSLFTAVSAFCNAGFDLFGGYRSLTHLAGEPVVLLTLSALIVLGGLGFSVIADVMHCGFHFKKLSLHSKLVLCITAGLILIGTVCILALEWSNESTLGGMSPAGKAVNSLFQSITFRTAGFASVDQAALSDSSKLIGILLMVIGASSASTGGGVKTTTFAMLILMVLAVIRARDSIVVFGRCIAQDTVRRAIAIVVIAIAIILLCTCALSVVERGNGFAMLDLMFESASAFSTTGLSTANTPTLSHASHWLLLPLMYLGRVGPLTLAFALANRMDSQRMNRVHFPEEKIMIG